MTSEMDEVSVLVGDWTRAHVRIQRTWKDSAELSVGNGVSGMSYRIKPHEMRLLAQWLSRAASAIDDRSNA